MEDRRLVESYQITIRENGMVIPSFMEMMKQVEKIIEKKKKILNREELFAELDKVVEEQKQKQEHKSVNEDKEEQNSVENTPLNDEDDDRCLEIAIDEAKQKAAGMEEKRKDKKKCERQ